MLQKEIVVFCLLTILFTFSACSQTPTTSPTPTRQIFDQSNPASVFCDKQGGRVVTRRDAGGNEYGVCIFIDNTECEEWAYFRHECRPGDFAVAPTPLQHPTYINENYGFSFDPPTDWNVEEEDHLVRFHHERLLLSVGYQWEEEDVTFTRGNVPASTYEEGTPVNFLGQPLPKHLLICDGAVKQVEYAPGLQIDRLRLIIWLEPKTGQDSDGKDASLTDEEIYLADRVLSSFALVSGAAPRIKVEDAE